MLFPPKYVLKSNFRLSNMTNESTHISYYILHIYAHSKIYTFLHLDQYVTHFNMLTIAVLRLGPFHCASVMIIQTAFAHDGALWIYKRAVTSKDLCALSVMLYQVPVNELQTIESTLQYPVAVSLLHALLLLLLCYAWSIELLVYSYVIPSFLSIFEVSDNGSQKPFTTQMEGEIEQFATCHNWTS